MTTFSRKIFCGLLMALLLAFCPVPASTSTGLAESALIGFSSPRGPTDAEEVETFMDGLIAAQLQAYHIPGAAVSVVKDGELLFAKGYGYADLKKRTPMLADQTLLRPGSISKLFTWTAVMQLAEQRKVDLSADVNTYLKKLQIPDTFPEPITLADLMTHTPGFENRNEGLFVRTAEEVMPLHDYLIKYLPERIYPPGQWTGYSNYGTALAGYIVEQVSGRPFEEYIEQNIFKPLGMSHSTFRRPVPSAWASDVAVSYEYGNGYYEEQMDWVQPGPAGGLSSTATDMAKFMIAHLQDGRYGNIRILQQATAGAMHCQHFTNDPRASGWTYGFSEADWNAQHIIWHGGSSFYFHSSLVLLPEHQVGLFVSYNSVGGTVARQKLVQAFLDHYYPVAPAPLPEPPADFDQHAEKYTGVYLETRQNQTDVEKMMALMSAITVEATGHGTLKTVGVGPSFPESEVAQWVEVEPLVFRKIEGEGTLYFYVDKAGNITSFIEKNDVQEVFLKQPWIATASFHMPLLILFLLLFLTLTVALPVGFVVKWRRNNLPSRSLYTVSAWLVWMFSASSLYFLVDFFVIMMDPEIYFRVPVGLERLLTLPLLITVLAIGLLILAVSTWVLRSGRVITRLYYTSFTMIALVFLWWLDYWNLLLYALQSG